MKTTYDFAVVGAGMAGASAAYFLSDNASVLVLEQESQPGYHTTGRSAALFSEVYGNQTIRSLTTGSKSFYLNPPIGFCDHPLLSQRGALFVGREDQLGLLDEIAASGRELVDSVIRVDTATAVAKVPTLKPDYVAGGVAEPDAMDIDVNGLHQGFLRGMRQNGGDLVCNAEVTSLQSRGDIWAIETSAADYEAKVLVNAAGAWCDVLAVMAGARPVGLVPKRRTIIQFSGPEAEDFAAWPLCVDAAEEFYFKPDVGTLLGSPADETPSPPCDAQPEEIDIANAADRIETASNLKIGRIQHSWAGLRSFVDDKTPVVGFDPDLPDFFWLAGQGGYGIQTAPAMGRLSAALATGEAVPEDLQNLGVRAAALDPARFHQP